MESWIDDDFIGTNTTFDEGSVFTLYFRCDNAWSPSSSEEASLDSLLDAEVLGQINKLGYATAADFTAAWGLKIGSDMANGEIALEEISVCQGETNGCVRIARETNASGNVEWAFFAKNPTSCRHDGYRREPGGGAQTGVPANFEGLLEGVTIRRCLETGILDEAEGESPSSDNDLAGWIVCWHGRAGHEFLVAYPEAEARNGIDLAGKVARKPWDGQNEDLSNDSLKMCYYDGDWYGSPNPAWFPSASFLQFQEGTFLVCEHSPGCEGNQWQMSPGVPAPMQIDDMVPEVPQGGTQMLTYWPS
jgi:hypothetical protein